MYGNNEGTVGGFIIHVVAASVWPTYLLSATAYSSLRLPPGLAEVAKEFDLLFTQRSCCVHNFQLNGSNHSNDENETLDSPWKEWYSSTRHDSTSSSSLLTVWVEGATGVHTSANGEYTRVIESKGKDEDKDLVYTKKSNGKWMLVMSRAQMTWQLKKRQGIRDRDTFLQVAYGRANTTTATTTNNNNTNTTTNTKTTTNNSNNSNNNKGMNKESSLPSSVTANGGTEGTNTSRDHSVILSLESLCWKEYHLSSKAWIHSPIRLTTRTTATTTPSTSSPRLQEEVSRGHPNHHHHRSVRESPSLSNVAAWVLSDRVPVPSEKSRSR